MDGLQPGEKGRVVRVIDGDALVLDTGQSVRLIGIEAPAGPYKERAGQPFHAEAKRMLEDMASAAKCSCIMLASPATGMTARLPMSIRWTRSAPRFG